MTFTRRELLYGLGGGVAGLTLSPLPWKLLDDVAIRTQHRRSLPLPPRGPVAYKPAACTLCPGGCPVRVRCVGPRPVSTTSEPGHPLGGGICALGLTLHHLAYHPLRLTAPLRRAGGRLVPVAWEAAVGEIAAGVRSARQAGQSVLVLDRKPGRTASQAWCELLAGIPGGVYAIVPAEDQTLAALQAARAEPGPLGIDLERTRTVLGIGAPLLDGWGRSARMAALRSRLRVVQVDTWPSASAALADEWLAVEPQAEGPLALALAHAIVRREPGRAGGELRATLAPFAPERVADRVGADPRRIEALAWSLVEQGPAVALGGGDPGGGPLGADAERAIALLNLVLGSVGREGGVVPRRPVPEASAGGAGTTLASLCELPAGSVRVAILDAADDGRALPWPLLARALAKDALVVSHSPFAAGLSQRASLLVPAPAPLERWDELLPTADATRASFALSVPMLSPPQGTPDTTDLVARLASALGSPQPAGSHEDRLKQRVAAIHGTARGRFVAREAGGWSETSPGDAAAAWDVLVNGGCWIDAPLAPEVALKSAPLPSADALARWLRPRRVPGELSLIACAARGTAGQTPVSPVLSKLYQESDLRPSAAVAAVHPETAQALALRPRRRVWIESAAGSVLAELRVDASIPRGRIVLAAAPTPVDLRGGADASPAAGALALITIEDDGTWRGTRVRVREA